MRTSTQLIYTLNFAEIGLKDISRAAYEQLCDRLDREPEPAVRSSATAEDLPKASFAGAALFLPFLPLLPKQILLNNFLTDFPAMAISTNSVDQELVQRPRRWDTRAFPSLRRSCSMSVYLESKCHTVKRLCMPLLVLKCDSSLMIGTQYGTRAFC